MTYFISNTPVEIQNAIKFIHALDENDAEFVIEIKPYKRRRSEAQNRLYWMWLGVISGELKKLHGEIKNKDELHDEFACVFIGTNIRELHYTSSRWGRILATFGLRGGTQKIIVPKSTKTLTKEEFSEYLLKIEAAAQVMDINLPHPSDYGFCVGTGKTGSHSGSASKRQETGTSPANRKYAKYGVYAKGTSQKSLPAKRTRGDAGTASLQIYEGA